MRKISEGFYFNEEKQQHEFDIPELIKAMGYEDTPGNRDKVTAVAMKVVRSLNPKAELAVRTSNPQTTRQAIERQGIRNVKIRRNALCPCQSGRKYKHCCLNHN